MESINQTGDSLPPPDFAVSASASFAPATYLTAIAVCLAFHFTFRLFRPVNITAVPWAKSAIPFVGNVLEYGADPVKFLLRQRELLGDVFRVNLVIMSITFCIGPQWNRWLYYETSEEELSLHQTLPLVTCGIIDEQQLHSGWVKRSLKTLRTGLTRQQQLTGAMKTSTRMASGMFDEWAASSEIPLFESCSRLLLRSILMAYFGDRFANDHEAELSVMIEGYHHALVNPWARVLPLWASPAGRMLSRMKGTMEALIKAEVDERMAFRDEWRDADDYLSYLLTANERSGFQESTSEYAAHFGAYVLLAHVNTAGNYAWTLLHLLSNPDQLSSFEAEIAANPPGNDNIYPFKQMPFAEACLKETGRLYQGIASVRYAPRDICGPGGVVVPKGLVAVSPLAVQQDPDLYENPARWDPRRFMPAGDGTPSDYPKLVKNCEFVQWGGGANRCPGERFVNHLLRGCLWPALLDNYRVEVVDGLVEGEGEDGVGVKPNHGESLGTPYGIRDVSIKVTKRVVPLSAVTSA